MTQNEFLSLCLTHDIDPAIALENEDLRAALTAKDAAEVERIINEEF